VATRKGDLLLYVALYVLLPAAVLAGPVTGGGSIWFDYEVDVLPLSAMNPDGYSGIPYTGYWQLTPGDWHFQGTLCYYGWQPDVQSWQLRSGTNVVTLYNGDMTGQDERIPVSIFFNVATAAAWYVEHTTPEYGLTLAGARSNTWTIAMTGGAMTELTHATYAILGVILCLGMMVALRR